MIKKLVAMRTKLIGCMVWVLGLMLIVASLDAMPDPPALDPHASMAKAPIVRACSDCAQTSLVMLPARTQVDSRSFIPEDERNRPGDYMARTGQAADPSPPAILSVPADRSES